MASKCSLTDFPPIVIPSNTTLVSFNVNVLPSIPLLLYVHSRLIMNMELMRSGYVPVIIKKDNRLKYYEALDKAHTTGDYTDFVKLVTEAENEMLDRYLSVVE